MQPVSADERQALHQRQLELLTSGFRALRPGGELVYATCSLAPVEDEAVLDAFLNLHPQQATIEPVEHVLPKPAPALASDGERTFHPQVGRAVRLWPHLYDTAGFFAARVVKQDSVGGQPSHSPSRPLEDAGFERMTHQEAARVYEHALQSFGFDLEAVVEGQELTLWAHDGAVYAIPQRFIARFADLPCVATGMRLGEWDTGSFVPSHELVARFSAGFTGRRLPLSDEQSAMWLAGREIRGLAMGFPTGTVVLLEDGRGRFLGLGKVLPSRIRNLLPRRLIY